jgi:anion-transporting  ArsA/GET3 family ATPase
VIVTGKGGTGKTTVCAALARAAADRGLRVGVAEVAPDPQIPRLLDAFAPEVGYEPRTIVPGIECMRIDPYAALGEYLGLQLGAAALVRRVVASQAFRQLLDASPGWRELITLGKLWHLEQMREGDRPRFDLLIVDAGATGHGMTFLDVPRVVVSAVRSGPLREQTREVEALIADPKRTALVPVALAEELPARETAELVTHVRDALTIGVDQIVVNAVNEAPFPPGLEDLDGRLAALPPELAFEALPSAGTLAACAGHLAARHALNRHYVETIADVTGLPVVCLPYLVDGLREPADLEPLAEALVA